MKWRTTGSGSMARTETAPSSGMNPSLLDAPDDAQSVAQDGRGARGFGWAAAFDRGPQGKLELRQHHRPDVMGVNGFPDIFEHLGLHGIVDREQNHRLLALARAAHFHPRDVDVVLPQDRSD